MLVDFQDIKPNKRYAFMAQSIIPRPIAWVMTENNDVLNIAPFSYFAPLSSDPATLVVSIGHRSDGRPKDTLRNLRKNHKCVVSIVDDAYFEKMHLSSYSFDEDESEVEALEIKTVSILDNFPPIPKGIKVAYFCEYMQEVDLKDSKTIPLILEIKHLYLDDEIILDNEAKSLSFLAIARVGRGYAVLQEIMTPEIPKQFGEN